MIEKPIEFPTDSTSYIINDRTYQSLMVSPYYYVKVNSVDGFWGDDISAESHPIPGFIGEKSGDIFRRGKTITLAGTIHARGLAELRSAEWFLKEMFWDTDHRELRFQHWNLPFQLYIRCRVNQDLVIVERIDDYNYSAGWTVALRADDPRPRKVSDDTIYPTWMA